jgi:hypothetical protein
MPTTGVDASRRRSLTRTPGIVGGSLLVLLAGCIAVSGYTMDWVNVRSPARSFDLAGPDADHGRIVAGLGLSIGVLGLLLVLVSLMGLRSRYPQTIMSRLGLLGALVLAAVAAWDIIDAFNKVPSDGTIRIGDGLWLALGAGIIAALGSLAAAPGRPRTRTRGRTRTATVSRTEATGRSGAPTQ